MAKSNVPVCVGVPESTPALDNVKLGGNPVADHVKGGSNAPPPVTVNVTGA